MLTLFWGGMSRLCGLFLHSDHLREVFTRMSLLFEEAQVHQLERLIALYCNALTAWNSGFAAPEGREWLSIGISFALIHTTAWNLC